MHVDAVEVVPGLLIGSAPGSRQRRALVKRGVTMVVDLRAECIDAPCPWPPEIVFHRSPITDRLAPDVALLDQLARTIVGMINGGHRVLVHCHAGVGRSATVICAVLVRMGWPLQEAYRTLRERRPQVAPTEAQLAALAAFLQHSPESHG